MTDPRFCVLLLEVCAPTVPIPFTIATAIANDFVGKPVIICHFLFINSYFILTGVTESLVPCHRQQDRLTLYAQDCLNSSTTRRLKVSILPTKGHKVKTPRRVFNIGPSDFVTLAATGTLGGLDFIALVW
jgi:hypothetical protein